MWKVSAPECSVPAAPWGCVQGHLALLCLSLGWRLAACRVAHVTQVGSLPLLGGAQCPDPDPSGPGPFRSLLSRRLAGDEVLLVTDLPLKGNGQGKGGQRRMKGSRCGVGVGGPPSARGCSCLR